MLPKQDFRYCSHNTATEVSAKKAQIRLNLRLWRSSRDLNPGIPCGIYEISSHASSTT